MKVICGRFMALGVAIVFVGSTRTLAATGMEYAVEDRFAPALIATVLTAVAPSS